MNFLSLKEAVMFQTNNDADDLGDYLPFLSAYLNEGYDRLVYAFCNQHVSSDSDDYQPLRNDKSIPNLPDWTHRAIADWATWLIYRNGNSQKQNRGYQYRTAFEMVLTELSNITDAEKGLVDEQGNSVVTRHSKQFYNIPE